MIKCKHCSIEYTNGYGDFCCVECMLEYYTDKIVDITGATTQKQHDSIIEIVEEIDESAYILGQDSVECVSEPLYANHI